MRTAVAFLSVQGGGTDDGDTEVIYDDVAADDQLWAIEDSIQGFKKFINKKSGRALSTDHQGGSSNGARVHIWQYLANASDQDWTIGPGSTAAAVKIISSARAGAVLSLVGSGTANNTMAQVSDDINGVDQDWVIVPVQAFDPTVSYMLVNKNSGTALSVYTGGTSNDDPVDIYPFVNQPDQYWNVIDIGGGYYHVVNGKSGRLLSLTTGDTVNGTIAMIYDDVNAPDQGWAIQAQPTGFYQLANQKRTTGVLSIVNAQTSLESRAHIYDDLAARDQSWSLVPALNGVTVNALDAQGTLSAWMTGSGMEDVNHEIYGGIYSQLIFGESFQEPASQPGISGMWSGVTTGTAAGAFTLGTATPFQGRQYQTITFTSGAGELGVENRGLDRWGINFTAGQPYDGYAYLRSTAPTRVYVAAESSSGAVYDETSVMVSQTGWTRYDFSLTPNASDPVGRVSLKLEAAGTVDIGYVFVEPGPAGRFKGLPVRADIAAAMQAQGNTVLRFGGSAILAKGYRWKNMVGPRELRPVLRRLVVPLRYERLGNLRVPELRRVGGRPRDSHAQHRRVTLGHGRLRRLRERRCEHDVGSPARCGRAPRAVQHSSDRARQRGVDRRFVRDSFRQPRRVHLGERPGDGPHRRRHVLPRCDRFDPNHVTGAESGLDDARPHTRRDL